jgi:hypothetical protein
VEDKYDAKHIARYFDQLAEGEWRRLEADGPARVSFHVHRCHLERYVSPGDRILEVGAGAGRFTIELARLGAEVVDVGQVIVESHCRVDNCSLSACSNPRVAVRTTRTPTALRERNAGESNRHGLTQGRKPVLKTGRATRPTHSGVFLRRLF